jgi:hypothetical protein
MSSQTHTTSGLVNGQQVGPLQVVAQQISTQQQQMFAQSWVAPQPLTAQQQQWLAMQNASVHFGIQAVTAQTPAEQPTLSVIESVWAIMACQLNSENHTGFIVIDSDICNTFSASDIEFVLNAYR